MSDLQNVPQNNDSNILSGSQVSDDYNNKNIPHFSQLKGCLFKIQNSFPLLQKLLNEKENENKNKFVIDIETVEVEVEDKIENILNVFSDLWNLNTSGPGSALILLHCLRRGVEEGMRFCSKSGKEKIDRNENENRSKNDNEKEFVSTSNKGKIENSDMKEKRINRDEDIAAAVLALLDTVETIPTTRHPRLFFIISWLLTTTNSEYSSELSSAITDDPFVAPQFMSKNVRKDCSVMDLFVSNSASDDGNNSDACEYFNVNLPILPSVFEWLDSRVNDILTVRSCDVLDSDALLSKGGALTSLIAMVTYQLPFYVLTATSLMHYPLYDPASSSLYCPFFFSLSFYFSLSPSLFHSLSFTPSLSLSVTHLSLSLFLFLLTNIFTHF